MANNNDKPEAFRRESVTLKGPDRIAGSAVQAGDSVEVYPFQRRHMVAAGSVEGTMEDIASEAEKEANALEVLKKPEERDDIDVWSVERAHKEGYGYGDGNEVKAGEAGEAGEEQPSGSEEPAARPARASRSRASE